MSDISRGFFWSGIERFSIQGISFLLSIIIARIVSPSAYGLIVMVQVFMSFFQIFIEGGFANALIQKQNRTEVDYNTVFIFNMIVATGLYLIMFFAAPIIADFYEEPQLTKITRVISLNLILSSLSIVQKTRLTIILDFKTQTKAGLIAVLISGVIGVVCAYRGMEVWALVIQSLLSQTLITLSLFVLSKWTPRFCFSKQSFVTLFRYGSKFLGTNILTSIYLNIYNLVIGKKYTSAELAYYNRAFTLSQFPSTSISDVMNRVIFPVLSRVQDDREKLVEGYFKYLHLSHYIILPLMGLMVVLAQPLVEVVLTEKWLPMVPYLRLFCLNFMLYPIIQQSANPVAAIGHVAILFRYQIIKRIISFVILFTTIGLGINAICAGIFLNSCIEAVLSIYVERKEIGIGFRRQLSSQLDVILLTIGICAIAYGITLLFSMPILQLLVGGGVGVILYLCMTMILNMQEKSYIMSFLTTVNTRFDSKCSNNGEENG